MKEQMLYEKRYSLTAGDFDQYLRIKPYSIFNLFQEVASLHAEELGLGFYELLKDKKAWVLFRSKFFIEKTPSLSEEIIIQTWPLPAHKIEYRREFKILNLQGETLVKGTSTWGVVNIETKRVTRDPIVFNGEFFLESNFEEGLDRLDNESEESATLALTMQIRPSDIDRYSHMNNAKYSELIYDALNLSKDEAIKQIQVNFINELKLGEIVTIYKTKMDNKYFLIGKKDHLTSFQAFVKTHTI